MSKMKSRGERTCLLSLVILTGFLFCMTHGETSDTPTATAATDAPAATTAPVTTAVLTTFDPTTPEQTTEIVQTTIVDMTTPGNTNTTVEVTSPSTEIMTEIVTEIVNSTSVVTDSLATLTVTTPSDGDDCNPDPCMNGGTCTDAINNYTCDCTGTGFEGTDCTTNIDDCGPDTCMNGGICTDGINNYTCDCTGTGFEGLNCTINIDDCGPDTCMNGGICTDGINNYTCDCTGTGFEGLNCTINIDDCGPDTCMNGGICTDGINNYTCDCTGTGFEGLNCTINIDDCSPNPCNNGATCEDGIRNFTCNCVAGYTEPTCDTNIDECESTPCDNGGTCNDMVNGYNCTCAAGYNGTTCMTDINDCATNPCADEGTFNCTDLVNDYTCECLTGYNGTNCENDIDACDPNPCVNEVNCTNHVISSGDATFTCYCMPGWMGTDCSEDIRECDNVTCLNGGTCNDLTNFYNCSCAPGFDGTDCENICPAGTFGSYCMESCTCVEGANCSNVDGSCTCTPAFDGAVCDKREVNVTASLISPDDTISEDDSFTLMCQVNLVGADLEEVAWHRGNVKLPSTSGQDYSVDNDPDMGMYNITIISADAEDTGSYICTAVTEGNQFTVSSDPIVIDVLVTGKIVDGPNNDTVELGETAILNCIAFTSEMLTLAWERNGERLSSSVNRTTVSNETGLETSGGTYYSITLEVSGIIRSDNGSYQCIVMDQAGNETDRGNFTITVIEIPELSNPRYIYNEDATQLTIAWDEYNVNTVTTNCTAFYNAIESNETQEMMFNNTNKEATIMGLTPFTNYSVSLICENEVGPSERLMYPDELTFQGAPELPTNVDVTDVEQTSALITWKPPEVTNGVLVGYTIQAIPQDCSRSCLPSLGEVEVPATSVGLTGLTPGRRYQAEVKAFNVENRIQGEFQRRVSEAGVEYFTTLPALPGPPSNVRRAETPETCTILWGEPLEPNGVIVSYTVTMNTYRLGNDTVKDTSTSAGIVGLTQSFAKSDLPDYSDFTFTVTATNEAGEGPSSDSVRCQKQQVGEPLVPEVLPEPSDKNHNSFTTTIPTFDDRNGPVSCYEVVVVQLEDATAEVNSNDLTYSPSRVKQYENRAIGVPYITQVMSSIPAGNIVTVGSAESERTSCYTGGSARRRRSSTPPKEIIGVNGPLNPDGIYTSFVRVYSPNDDEVLYTNGPFMMRPVILDPKPPNVAGIVGGIFGSLIAACLIVVIILILRRKKMKADPGDRLMSSHTANGVRENGNGMGMQNLGIEDVDEMIVKPIKVENLEKTIRHKAQEEKRIFWAEYKALPNRPPAMVTMNHSNLPANKDKNRYINIIAYDHTRVKLKTVDGIEGSDYINASYVNGYQSPDKFIAAQGPKDNTLEDFWRMIWEYNCSTVVMLTKCVEDGKDKCSQYWPNKGSITYGRFKVTLDNIKETAEYVIRSFFLSEDGKENGQRSITQFHFLGWPDHGQPDYPSPMMCLIKRVRHLTSKMNHRANIVVHCSAGVGRTGTYIVIDTMLDMMRNEKQVDIYNFIHDIRQQRNTLVQSFVQYFFIHMALLEEYLFGHSDVGMSDFPSYYQQLSNKSDLDDDLTRLEVEFRRACKLGVNGTEQTFANIDQNKDKNRIGHILPFDKNVVKLERLIGEEFSDYINASYITGYQRKNMYIATQGPLPNTIADFWRMVWESQTSTIVMLTEISQKGHEMCAQYWPLEVDETEDHGDITVTMVAESDDDEAYTIRDFEISHAHVMQNIYGNIDNDGKPSGDADDAPDESDSQTALYGNIPETPSSPPPTPMKDVRKIRQYHFRGWPEVGVPDSGIDLMRLVNKSHLHQNESGAHPIVVHCSAGAGRTGVFIGLNVLMSRMEEESMIDVFQTVRGLRQQRPHMVQDLAQFRFCYSAMAEYIESQSTEYQNFVARV